VEAPSPKYSIIEFVAPFTVNKPANLRITSFGDGKASIDDIIAFVQSLKQ
jgi:hypothetical protein